MNNQEYMKMMRDMYMPILEEQSSFEELDKLGDQTLEKLIKDCSRIFGRRKRNKSLKNYSLHFTKFFFDKEKRDEFLSSCVTKNIVQKYDTFEFVHKDIHNNPIKIYVMFGTN